MSRTFPSGAGRLGHQSHFAPCTAWNVAFVAFLGFINALVFGELIASGVNPNTGARCEIDPVEWMRTGLILDVRNGDLIEVGQGKRIVRWSAITLRAAKATRPQRSEARAWSIGTCSCVRGAPREAGYLQSKHASLPPS